VSTRSPGPRRAPAQVGALVPRVLSDLGLDATAQAVRVLQIWDEALGELAPHCRPEGIRRGVLHARVPDSAWMQRIQLEKPRILAALASRIGERVATDLRLRIGNV
jgi:predicted nucleic acid-binding Zn ribbon protein